MEIDELARQIIERDLHREIAQKELGCSDQELKDALVIVDGYHKNGRIKFWKEV